MKSFLISCLFHWIEEFYIDGFRLDAAGQFHYYEFPSEAEVPRRSCTTTATATIRKAFASCSR